MIGLRSNGSGISETLGAAYTAGSSATGTTVTASGTANTMGSWVSLGTPTFQYEHIVLMAWQTAASDKCVDIGVNDGSGNWHVICDRIPFPGAKFADYGHGIPLPIRLKAGQQVGMRIQASTASHVIIATITGFSTGINGFPGYSRMVRLTASTTSRGVAVDQGATANTKGSWAELIASTSEAYDAFSIAVGTNGDVTRTAANNGLIDIGQGSAGSEYVILPDMYVRWSTTNDGPAFFVGTLPVPIPAGVRLAARMGGSDTVAGDRTVDISAHGFTV